MFLPHLLEVLIIYAFHVVDKYIVFAIIFYNKFNKSMDLFYSFADDR